MGEGETTITKLMDAFEGKIKMDEVPGIGWLENEKLRTTPRAPLINDLGLFTADTI